MKNIAPSILPLVLSLSVFAQPSEQPLPREQWGAPLVTVSQAGDKWTIFFREGNYVDMAKRYRRYAMDAGLFVSLQEKIARKPIVKELIAAPLMRAGILTNYKKDGNRYQRTSDEKERYRLTTFDERGQFLRQLKSNGLDRLTVVLTGWPRLGYDRQHPDVLPPAPDAGGYEGMKRLADTCRELGYLFSLHDQYRDFYVDAPSYDLQFAIHEEDATSPPRVFPGTRFGQAKEGDIPFMDHWDGGKMTYLNGRFMLGHLIKNYQGLFDHGIRPAGSYLDVFGYVPPDEDFNPEHPTTRTDCLRERAKCYDWSRNNLGFVGTEAACDWTIPFTDISSPLRPKNGVAIPLFDLVFHDAILTPYGPEDLRGLLNGGLPQISSRGELTPEALAQINRLRALHARVALLEMTKHEFLDKGYRKEQTTFSDGTRVTVDWDTKTVQIQPELNTTSVGAETRKVAPDKTQWTAGSGQWSEAARWSDGLPDPFRRVEIHGSSTVVIPDGTYVAGNLEVGLNTRDHARVEVDGGQLILIQDSLRVGELSGGSAEFILKDGAMHGAMDVYVGAANSIPGRATQAALRIQGGSFLGRSFIVGAGWGAESFLGIEGSRVLG